MGSFFNFLYCKTVTTPLIVSVEEREAQRWERTCQRSWGQYTVELGSKDQAQVRLPNPAAFALQPHYFVSNALTFPGKHAPFPKSSLNVPSSSELPRSLPQARAGHTSTLLPQPTHHADGFSPHVSPVMINPAGCPCLYFTRPRAITVTTFPDPSKRAWTQQASVRVFSTGDWVSEQMSCWEGKHVGSWPQSQGPGVCTGPALSFFPESQHSELTVICPISNDLSVWWWSPASTVLTSWGKPIGLCCYFNLRSSLWQISAQWESPPNKRAHCWSVLNTMAGWSGRNQPHLSMNGFILTNV